MTESAELFIAGHKVTITESGPELTITTGNPGLLRLIHSNLRDKFINKPSLEDDKIVFNREHTLMITLDGRDFANLAEVQTECSEMAKRIPDTGALQKAIRDLLLTAQAKQDQTEARAMEVLEKKSKPFFDAACVSLSKMGITLTEEQAERFKTDLAIAAKGIRIN